MEFIPYKGFTDAVSKAFKMNDEECDTYELGLAANSTANATDGSNSTGNDTSGVRRRRLQLEAGNGTNSTNETTSTEVKRVSENSKKLGSSNIVDNMGIMLLFGAIIFVLILIVFLFRLVANTNYRIYRVY